MLQLSSMTRNWFKKIEGQEPFEKAPLMDIYYLCLLIGIYSKKTPEQIMDAQPAFLPKSGWPSEYKENSNLIISLFLNAEIDRFLIDRKDKDAIKDHISQYLDPQSIINLSPYGINHLNNYAYTGFLLIKENFGEEPSETNAFLNDYNKLLSSYCH